ncbi:hypothetical protein [Pseudomonas syringae]
MDRSILPAAEMPGQDCPGAPLRFAGKVRRLPRRIAADLSRRTKHDVCRCTPSAIPDHASDSIILRLSTLDDDLIVQIPDGQNTPPNWDVYPILGDDPEEPEWQGLSEPTGVWMTHSMTWSHDGNRTEHPRFELEKYLNSTVELRYKFADESSLEPCSEPLKLYIEA